MLGVHVYSSRKHCDLSHRLSCLAAKMKRREMLLWLWDHLSPSSVHGRNKLLSLVSLHTHSALPRRRRWRWHKAKEQLIEIFPNGWSIACVVDREKSLVMPLESIFISRRQSEFRLMNSDSNPRSHVLFSGINIASFIGTQCKLLRIFWQIFCLTKDFNKCEWYIHLVSCAFRSFAQTTLEAVSILHVLFYSTFYLNVLGDFLDTK